MAASIDNNTYYNDAFDRGTDPLVRLFSVDQAQRLAQYQGDESLRQRIDELAAKCNEGSLSSDEQAEYEGYVRANKFVAILQAKARKFLANAGERA